MGNKKENKTQKQHSSNTTQLNLILKSINIRIYGFCSLT